MNLATWPSTQCVVHDVPDVGGGPSIHHVMVFVHVQNVRRRGDASVVVSALPNAIGLGVSFMNMVDGAVCPVEEAFKILGRVGSEIEVVEINIKNRERIALHLLFFFAERSA
jgi:hypothetical protein